MFMKKILIKLIKNYQRLPGLFHYNCKFYPSCSNYTIEAIETFGVLKGTFLGIKRILKCNPFSKGGYDPIKK